MTEDRWADEAFRLEVGTIVDRLLADEVREAAMGLWRLGFTTGEFGFAGGLWNIWGPITDEFTHPDDRDEGIEMALEPAAQRDTPSATSNWSVGTATTGSMSDSTSSDLGSESVGA